jgi:hypothetical protein
LMSDPAKRMALGTREVLLDGVLDDGTAWELVSYPTAVNTSCHVVNFISGPTNVESCVSDSATGPFRLVTATEASGVPFVFGLVGTGSEDSNVLRVLDAHGTEVAQNTRDGRVFAIPLPKDAVGPFTIELYDFDREWYDSTFDDRDGDVPYLKPGSAKIASTRVTVEK